MVACVVVNVLAFLEVVSFVVPAEESAQTEIGLVRPAVHVAEHVGVLVEQLGARGCL